MGKGSLVRLYLSLGTFQKNVMIECPIKRLS